MKETGMVFTSPMVRAILEGRKTQTRRIAKPVKHPDLGNLYTPGALAMGREPQHVIDRACPLGQPGDRIYVRETFVQGYKVDPATGAPHDCDEEGNDVPMTTWYRATDSGISWEDGDGWETNVPWRPAIHMPKALARIWLEITSVRIERLQDISDADCIAEGIKELPHQAAEKGCWWTGDVAAGAALHGRTPHNAFRLLWESTGGDWDANPWVWAIDFKVLSATGRPA